MLSPSGAMPTDSPAGDTPGAQLQEALFARLRSYERLAVAYSGGVDSAYLAWAAHQVLGERMLAVIADSPSLPRQQLAAAVEFAGAHGIPLRVVETSEMEQAAYVRNDSQRCFHCKDELFRVMQGLAAELGGVTLAYGRNRDDAGDFRPGQKAAEEHGVVAPLYEAGLRKQDVRALARAAGLDVWDKPASACLASRIEYGRAVTRETLEQVEKAEAALHALGLRQVRVRHHGDLARVEIARDEMPAVLSLPMLDAITAGVKGAGFTYVTLDTAGYRSGSMNDVLPVAALLRTGARCAS